MEFKINDREREALCGLPLIQRVLYYEGIRPYMDYSTGIVGIKRGISLQSLSEVLYVNPHQGYRPISFSRDQIRRALCGLVKAGLLESKKYPMKLVFKCLLASQDYCVQKKAATNPPQQAATGRDINIITKTSGYDFEIEKPAIPKTAKAATPPVSGNYYIFLLQSFEKFWQAYPVKKSKQKAWKVFHMLNPSEQLFLEIMQSLSKQKLFYQQQQAAGQWMPNWKHPANWLQQQCWQDELRTTGVTQNDSYQKNRRRPSNASELIWESCKSGFSEAEENAKVISLVKYR